MKEIMELFNELKNIKYGWHDINGNIHESLKDYLELYQLSYEDKVREDDHAVCWELCEIQRDFFNSRNIDNKVIFAYLKNSRNNACHTFSIFYLNDKAYWFEASWNNKKGIHEFNNDEEIFEYYRNNFEDFARSEYNKEDLEFYSYEKVKEHIRPLEFYEHCLSSKKLTK